MEKSPRASDGAPIVAPDGVVVLNAKGYRRERLTTRSPRWAYANRYSVIAVGMVASAVGIGLWQWVVGWDHAVLWIEGVLIVLFAAFWMIQTQELWDEGLRDDSLRDDGWNPSR